MKPLAWLLLVVTVLQAAADNDTSAELFTLVNPTSELGFVDDAIGVTLPDSNEIMAKLTESQQAELVQKTLADIERVYGGMTIVDHEVDDPFASAGSTTNAKPSTTGSEHEENGILQSSIEHPFVNHPTIVRHGDKDLVKTTPLSLLERGDTTTKIEKAVQQAKDEQIALLREELRLAAKRARGRHAKSLTKWWRGNDPVQRVRSVLAGEVSDLAAAIREGIRHDLEQQRRCAAFEEFWIGLSNVFGFKTTPRRNVEDDLLIAVCVGSWIGFFVSIGVAIGRCTY